MSHVGTATINHISLCSGYGGIDLGLRGAVGERLRTVAYVEIEAFAVANLVAKTEAGLLDAAPVWSDLRSFPWGKFHGLVDILSGGYPCQPFSAAGKRRGHEDPRHLWPAIAAGIAAMRPGICFFENVEGHISLGLRDVLHDLVELGYRATWGIFSASEVGAPHQRKRVFVMAYRDGERGQLLDWWRVAAEQVPVGDGKSWRDELMADPMCERRQQVAGSALSDEEANGRTRWNIQQPDGHYVTASHVQGTAWPSRPGEPQHGWEPPRVIVGDAKGNRGQVRQDIYSRNDRQRPIEGCSAMGNAASAGRPQHPTGRDDSQNHSGATHEDAADGQTQPALGGDADGVAPGLGLSEHTGLSDHELAEIRQWMERVDNRTDELRLLGNGVLAQCAAVAFRTLWEELLR